MKWFHSYFCLLFGIHHAGRLLTALICEYLDWAQLNHSLKVYLPECNLVINRFIFFPLYLFSPCYLLIPVIMLLWTWHTLSCRKKILGSLSWKNLVAKMDTILIEMEMPLCSWMFWKDSWNLRLVSCTHHVIFSFFTLLFFLSGLSRLYCIVVMMGFGSYNNVIKDCISCIIWFCLIEPNLNLFVDILVFFWSS